MNNWIPDTLYRYRGVGSQHFVKELENLKNGKVWLNFLDSQNDPFEGAALLQPTSFEEFSQNIDEFRDYLKENFSCEDLLSHSLERRHVDEANLNASKFHQYVRSQAVVASFSKSWDSTLMWGHYADQFAGICLKFDFDYSATRSDGPPLYQEQYWKDSPPTFSAFQYYLQTRLSNEIQNLKDDQERERIENIAHETMKLAVTSKSFDWVYEEEFRMVSIGGVPGYYPIPGMKLTEVIFGERTKSATYQQVISALGDEIRYSKMVLAPNRYGYRREAIAEDLIADLLK